MGLYVSFEYRITTLKSFELTFKRQTKAKLHDSEGCDRTIFHTLQARREYLATAINLKYMIVFSLVTRFRYLRPSVSLKTRSLLRASWMYSTTECRLVIFLVYIFTPHKAHIRMANEQFGNSLMARGQHGAKGQMVVQTASARKNFDQRHCLLK